MHELSLTMDILEIVEKNAENLKAKIVHEIEMDVGELSGVEYDALIFAFENAPKSEILKNVKLIINKIPVKAVCNSCKHEFEECDYYTPCPKCNSFDINIEQGKEFKIKSIKID